jgi:hypothetical protein
MIRLATATGVPEYFTVASPSNLLIRTSAKASATSLPLIG